MDGESHAPDPGGETERKNTAAKTLRWWFPLFPSLSVLSFCIPCHGTHTTVLYYTTMNPQTDTSQFLSNPLLFLVFISRRSCASAAAPTWSRRAASSPAAGSPSPTPSAPCACCASWAPRPPAPAPPPVCSGSPPGSSAASYSASGFGRFRWGWVRSERACGISPFFTTNHPSVSPPPSPPPPFLFTCAPATPPRTPPPC